jgi:thiol-disulfide isomerase/thioredoxin
MIVCRRLALFAVVCICGLPLLSACGDGARQPSGLLGPGAAPPPLVAQEWLNGPPPSASDMAGHVVVIDVWAHWCGPCRAEAPHIVEAYDRFKSQGVLFVGLSPDDVDSENRASSAAFVTGAGIPWPNGLGAGKTANGLGVHFLPSLIVIGTDGRVSWNSDLDGTLEEAIEAALARAEK